MNITKQKVIGFPLSLIMLSSAILSYDVHADTPNAAAAAFGVSGASCENMTASVTGGYAALAEEKAGKSGWRLKASGAQANIRCKVDDSFMFRLDGEYYPVVELEYFDDSYGGFCIYYDSRSGSKGEFVQLENSGTWKTKVFRLYDAYFGNGLYTDDFWISANRTDVMGQSSDPVLIGSVRLSKSEKSAPFAVSVDTANAGNIFFEGDKPEFDISYENIGSRGYMLTPVYDIRDYSGNIIKSYTSSKSIAKSAQDKLTVSGIPYGVYKLDIKLIGDGVEQIYTTDFSYARRADSINYHFGINVHYDDENYTSDDVKNVSELIKSGGFGFVRSPLRWNAIEKTKGVYKIPENIMYANKYLDEIGLEMLGILYTENKLYTSYPYYRLNSAQLTAFKNYCEYTANALKDYTDYYCMLNEVNYDSSGYINNEQEYVSIAKAGYEGVKNGHSQAMINGGSLAGWSRAYANKTYELGILNYCDSYSMHVYDHRNGPETYYMYQAEPDHKYYLNYYDTTKLKEAWITESGWPTRAADNTADEALSRNIADAHDSSSEIEQAQWYARSMAINGDKSRIDKFFYYSMCDNDIHRFDIQSNFGILRAKTYDVPFAAKPAYITVCAYNDLIGDADFVSDEITDGSGYALRYKREDGSYIDCVWGAEYYNQPGKGKYIYKSNAPYIVIYDMYGNAQYIENKNGSYAVTIEEEPVYIADAQSVPDTEVTEDPDDNPSTVPDAYMTIEQNGESIDSLWYLNDEDKLDVTFKTTKEAGTEMTVICASYKKGILSAVETEQVVTDSDIVKLSFNNTEVLKADSIKLMVYDSLNGLTPLQTAVEMDYFSNDKSVAAAVADGVCTIKGQLKNKTKNENVMISVFANNTRRLELDMQNIERQLLYQGQQKSGDDGSYEFSFKLPQDYDADSAFAVISSSDSTVQCVVPMMQSAASSAPREQSRSIAPI